MNTIGMSISAAYGVAREFFAGFSEFGRDLRYLRSKLVGRLIIATILALTCMEAACIAKAAGVTW